MYKEGHFLFTSLMLNLFFGIPLLFLLLEKYGIEWNPTGNAYLFSLITFLFGCGIPDIDFFITTHRNRMHSIGAVAIYGLILCILMLFLFQLYYWFIPVILGMIGYLSHLILDEIGNYIGHKQDENYMGNRTLKLWKTK